MNHTDARQVLLLRAFEAPLAPPWTDADAAWASREATASAGEASDATQLVARRAAVAMGRLTRVEPLATAALALTRNLPWSGAWVLLAFLAGLAMDALGAQRVVNLLAPPLWAMLAWNLFVYLGLALHAIGAAVRPETAPSRLGPLRQALGRVLLALARRAHGLADRPSAPAIGRFLSDWWHTSQALNAARLATVLHLAAAALACGALLSMYARGVFFDFRAGWESTFFDAPEVYGALSALLAPASWISGLALPGLPEFGALRLPGSAGESARRWIHLFAITLAGGVIVPRLVLAAWSGWRARRLALAVPIALDEPYFVRLVRAMRGESVTAQVLPYNYQAAAARLPALQRFLEQHLGVRMVLGETVPMPLGAEDALDAHLPKGRASSLTVVLFAMTATPERETHRAFVMALGKQLGPSAQVLVVVDESGFRQRLTGADATQRLNDRRQAWSDALQDLDGAPLFAELSPREAAE
jgi:Protein of unknown function (DUF2868)